MIYDRDAYAFRGIAPPSSAEKQRDLESRLWNALRDTREIHSTLDEPLRSQYAYVIEYLRKAIKVVEDGRKR